MAHSISVYGPVAVLKVGGRLDTVESAAARPAVLGLIDSEIKEVVMDLGECTFLDTAGIGILMLLHKRLLTSGRRLRLFGLHGQPRHLITFLSVDRAIPLIGALPAEAA